MKKRMRKKKHLGKFREYGFGLCIVMDHFLTNDEICDHLDKFSDFWKKDYACGISKMIKFDYFIELGNYEEAEYNKYRVIEWFLSQKGLAGIYPLLITDVWHGGILNDKRFYKTSKEVSDSYFH